MGRNFVKIGNTRILKSIFYNSEGVKISGVNASWSCTLPEGLETEFEIVKTNQQISISCSDNENLIGHVVQITLSDENNIYSEYKMTVKVGDVFG